MNSIETIREAWRRYHAVATNQSAREPLMSIPVNRSRDADCILVDAIDELATLRAEVDRLARELREARAAIRMDAPRCSTVDMASFHACMRLATREHHHDGTDDGRPVRWIRRHCDAHGATLPESPHSAAIRAAEGEV